jgi:hypothetical protein
LAEITAIDPAAAGRESNEVVDLAGRRVAETFPTTLVIGEPFKREGLLVGRRLPGRWVYEVDPGAGRASYRNVGFAIVGGLIKPNLYLHGFRRTSIGYGSHEPAGAP